MKLNNPFIIITIILFAFSFTVIGAESNTSNTKSNQLDQLFSMSIEELMSVQIVTASKKQENISDIPASVFVMTREDIQKMGLSSYTEILDHIPGFYKIDDYYWLGSTSYGVRGFYSTGPMNNIIVLVNGVSQISDKYSDYPDVKINVPIEAIERVEVIYGPMSVIYGPGAFFGAINIITHDEENPNETNTLTYSYGSLNTHKASIRYSSAQDETKFTLSASYNSTNGIDKPFSEMTFNKNIFNYVGLDENATSKGQKDEQRKYFGLTLNHKSFFTQISISETLKDVFDGQPNLPRGSEMTTKAVNAVVGYNKKFNTHFSTRARAGYYSHSHMLDYEIFFPNYYEVDSQHTNSFDIELNGFYTNQKQIDLTFGLYRRTVLDIHQISDFGYYGVNYGDGESGLKSGDTFSTHAVYAQLNYTPFTPLHFIGGVRIDHLDDYDIEYARGMVFEEQLENYEQNRQVLKDTYTPQNNGFSPVSRLAAIYHPKENHTLKIMWGQATKQPSFTENYRQMPGGYPFLDAAQISTLEANYTLGLRNKISISTSFFVNRLNKLISTTNIYDQETRVWDIFSYHSGKMETIGSQIFVHWNPFPKIRIDADFIYQKSTNLKPGYKNIKPGYSPEKLGYFKLFFTPRKNSCITLSARYIDKMYTLWKTDTVPEEGKRIGDTIDGYSLIDINFCQDHLFNTNYFASLKIQNILDHQTRFPTTTSNLWANKGTLGLGRTVYFKFGIKF